MSMTDFTIPRQQSAENTDKPEVDLSPPNPQEHRTLFAQGCTKLWSWRWGRNQALEGSWMTHAAMLNDGAASVWSHHDGEPAWWRSSP